jgi:hypothetical protein
MTKNTNVEYSIEAYNGSLWEELYVFTIIEDAINELEKQKKSLPHARYRLIRSEWEVIG